jgi:RNA polymerase sigma-70 factor (ECF subfamily)
MSTVAALDDRTLSDRLARGDRQALGQLYSRYAGLVFGVALRVVKDRALAEELVQDTFLEAWRRATQYDAARATPAAWLVTIAKSRAIDRTRTATAAERASTAASHTPVEPTEGLESLLDLARSRVVLEAHLSRLPPEQRLVLELAWRDGLSQSEIASKANLPLGTVKTRTRLAMLELSAAVRATLR